ncbi:MAG TPA: hypothetical protein VNT77_07885 [Allosphingosinicella sp.]|nr:hypothetical protein [Allosphingosinicella sp.]
MLPKSSRAPLPASRPVLAAAAYAAAELGLTLTLGGFFDWGRAEALLFLAFRPWLLLLLALLIARWRLPTRIGTYACALLLAALSETLLLLALGAGNPWREMLRGLAGGAMLLLGIDLALQTAGRWWGKWGRRGAAALAALLFLTPIGLRPYEAVVLDQGGAGTAERPELMLMTALPIIWGEGGAFDPDSHPAAAYDALEREFTVRPLDYLDERSLSGRLLLLAQPRGLAPAELVALDRWIRGGGRALILTDPALAWPTDLPLGDVRRPPPVGLLGPLLRHWGLELEPPSEPKVADTRIADRKLRLASPGRFRLAGGDCTLVEGGLLADCRIGQGRALLLADADLLNDGLWAAPAGAARHSRMADNPLIVADLLDQLADAPRQRLAGDVQWISVDADRTRALLLALAPLALAFAVALILGFGVRR